MARSKNPHKRKQHLRHLVKLRKAKGRQRKTVQNPAGTKPTSAYAACARLDQAERHRRW